MTARLEATRAWLDQAVVAQNFCPFASRPLREGRVRLAFAAGIDIEAALGSLVSACRELRAQEDTVDTLLLVLPAHFDDLRSYSAGFELAELVVAEVFAGEFVLAGFHPDYLFAEVEADDIAHWIHRSPYPVWHVLRGEQLEAVAPGIDVASVLARNRWWAAGLGEAWFETHLAKWRRGVNA